MTQVIKLILKLITIKNLKNWFKLGNDTVLYNNSQLGVYIDLSIPIG